MVGRIIGFGAVTFVLSWSRIRGGAASWNNGLPVGENGATPKVFSDSRCALGFASAEFEIKIIK